MEILFNTKPNRFLEIIKKKKKIDDELPIAIFGGWINNYLFGGTVSYGQTRFTDMNIELKLETTRSSKRSKIIELINKKIEIKENEIAKKDKNLNFQELTAKKAELNKKIEKLQSNIANLNKIRIFSKRIRL